MTHQVQRGGTWFYRRKQQAYLRLAYRRVDKAHYQDDLVGFRVVCLPREVAPPRILLRGGSWLSNPRGCPAAHRGCSHPADTYHGFGFRVVCLPWEAKPAPVVSRGGAWCNCFPWKMRSKARHYCRPHRADDIDGFRVVCLPREVTP